MRVMRFVAGLALAFAGLSMARATELIVAGETAGIDGRDPDRPFSGGLVVDAVHRAVLLRFPDAASAIARRLNGGEQIDTAELLLDYAGYEVIPAGYLSRPGLSKAAWTSEPPTWHLVAHALRQPWRADVRIGPTFNASVAGAKLWIVPGAASLDVDRHSRQFGPTELSQRRATAAIDVTATLTDEEFGARVEQRLRGVADHGFLLQKWERFDQRYRAEENAFEWSVATGGHGLSMSRPRLRLVFKPGNSRQAAPIDVGHGPDVERIARTTQAPRRAVAAFSKAEFESRRATSSPAVPTNGQEWPAARFLELARIGGDAVTPWMRAVETGDHARYTELVREILATPPRYWRGWSLQDELLVWHRYRHLLPAYVQQHVVRDWEAWLMPDLETKALLHPQGKEALEEYGRSGDWRGRASFFRGAFNHGVSTQNFNHMAAMGALLGGSVIDSERAMADGRHGLEHYALRLWTWNDGSTQEILDHYYLSITLSAQKMFADLGPAPIDRLMGRVMVDRTVDMLGSIYHPRLRRMISASGRTTLQGILAEQDGIYGVLHTLSRKGALNYLDLPFDAKVNGMRVWGYNFPPGRVAMQQLQSPWGLPWLTRLIDEKRLPFEEVATDTVRGQYNPPLWRRTFLGNSYGLASEDFKEGIAPVVAQWIRGSGSAKSIEDVGTFTLRYAINEPDMVSTTGGTMPHMGGVATFQYRNRAIVFTKPRTEIARTLAMAGNSGVRSLATVMAFWRFGGEPAYLTVDGKAVGALPAHVRPGQVIALRDGPSYVAVIPMRATDLGRDREIVIGHGGGGKLEYGGAGLTPAFTITSFNLRRDDPLAVDASEWPRISTASYGGFVIEMGDEAEYGSFERFQAHMAAARLKEDWNPFANRVELDYTSAGVHMEAGFDPSYAQGDVHYAVKPGQQAKAFAYRRVNGQWPYLTHGLERDTPYSQQGTTGRLEKNGAVLRTDPGRRVYLTAEPESEVYVGYNPLPDLTSFSFSVPRGIAVDTTGKVGMLKVTIEPVARRVLVDHAGSTEEELLVRGFLEAPRVELNGARMDGIAIRDGIVRVPLKAPSR